MTVKEAKAYLKNYPCVCEYGLSPYACKDKEGCEFSKAIRTICEEERPHGEWIIDGHHYKCSRCGKTLAIMFSETDEDDLIGCPFCLADMRKEKEG